MANKERENFYRGATLTVDNTNASFVDLLELHLSRHNLSFEDFINQHQHQLYHLFYNTRKCCQCTTGYIRPNNRILFYKQLEVLFDKYAKKPRHRHGNRSDFCCARTKTGITTDLLDITLTRTLLVNLCHDVFWYSCLNLQTQSFEDFLNQNKHHIYHLRERNIKCCQCPIRYIFPKTNESIDLDEWRLMFNLPILPCPRHRMSPSDLVCTVSASSGINVSNLGYHLTKLLIEQCCPLRKTIDILIDLRNTFIGHASAGRISDADYKVYISNIELGIMEIAQVCGNEALTKQSFSDACKRPLDETLCIKYQNMLLEQIQKENRLEKKLDDMTVEIPDKIEQSIRKTFNSNIQAMVEQSVQTSFQNIYEPNSKLTLDQQRQKRKLLEHTLNMIECHSAEDTFVDTNVIPIALDELEAKGVIVITGTSGSGKSRNSLEILRRFSAGHDMYCGIKLNNISEWNDIINHDDSLIVVLDDVFGKSNCIFNAEDEKIFDKIYSMVLQGCVKVIFTLRNTIKSNAQVSDIINRQRLFQKSRFINLDSADIKMHEEQRKECLLKYCKSNKIRISSTEYLVKGKHSLDQSVPISLSLMEINKIAKTDVNPFMGYPESCYIFTSNREFTQQGVGFFQHPTKSVCNQIESLRKAGKSNEEEALQYVILVYMALHEDLLDIHEIKMNKFIKVQELVYHKEKFTVKSICRGLKTLTQKYLKTNFDGTYSFQHRSIFEGVLLSCKDIEAEHLIPLLHIDFIMEIGRLDGNFTQPEIENETTLLFKKKNYNLLAQTIVSELRKSNSSKNLMGRLCSSSILRNADGYFLDEILKEYMLTKCEMFCRLRNLGSEIEWRNLSKQIFIGDEYITSKRTSVTFLTGLLKYSIKYADNNDTICHILKLIEQDINIHKKNYINTTHEKCFTKAILQSCAYLDSVKLNMILKFVKKNKIKLDTPSFVVYDFGLKCGFNIDRKIAAIRLMLHTFLTSHLIDSRHILEKVIDVNDTSLIELFFELHGQSYPKKDIPLDLYYACAKGAFSIVQWVFSNFPQKEFNIEKALLEGCSCGCVETRKASSSFQDEHLNDSEKVVLFLLNNFRTKLNNLRTAMCDALFRSEFHICRILMENTDNYFDAQAVLLGIARKTTYAYQSKNACFDFVKYLVTDYSCLNVDNVFLIAEKFNEDFDMVKWIMSKTQKEIFYTAWKKHKWIHKKICALELIYDTEFYKTLILTKLIEEELTYGNNECLRFLIEKIDIEKAEKVIVEKVCSCGDENLMKMIFEKCGSLNIVDAMNIALKNRNWVVVQWLCKNCDIEKLNFGAIIEEAITCAPISVIKSLTEIIDRKYFNSRDILLAFERNNSYMDDADPALLIKWYLQDSKNRYRINDLLKLSCMKYKNNTQMLFNVLFQNRKNEFLHLQKALTTLLVSRDFDSVKILLCTFDTTIFDMNMLMNSILDELWNSTHADKITMWLLQTYDPILFDIPYILEKTCCNDDVKFVKWMYHQYDFSNLTLETVFINACKYSAISVLKWIFEKITFPISLKKVFKKVSNLRMSVVIFLLQNFKVDRSDIDQICRMYSSEEVDQLEFQLCIFEAYGSELVDVKSVFDSVCRLNSIEEVKWFKSIVDNDLLNFFSAINEAVCGNTNETFLFLFELVNIIGPKEANMIFIKACYHGNLEPVKILHNKYGESLKISVAMNELCKNKSITHKHFDVFKFLVSFSSPSIIDCQLLLNQACKSGDIQNIIWLFNNFDPDIFEVRSVIYHAFAFDTYFISDYKRHCENIMIFLLHRCHCDLADIQAIMETVCGKGMIELMRRLIVTFGPDSFDFRRILSIELSPINTEIFCLAFFYCKHLHLDLQNIIVSACKTGGNEVLEVINSFPALFGQDEDFLDYDSTIHSILDMQCSCRHDIRNEVIKLLLMNSDTKTIDIMSILKKIYTLYSGKRNDLVLWILKNCSHSLIDIQETLNEICKNGDIGSMQYMIYSRNYANFGIQSCIHSAFGSGSLEMIQILIKDFPEIIFDKQIAMNNASSSGFFAVVQWLFHKYSVCPNRFSFLEPILDLKLAQSIFDLNSAMLNACRNGNTDVVQWLLQLYSYETFDMKLSLIETSASGEVDLVKWMLAVYDNDIFDIETSLISACKNEKTEVVKFFIEKFGKDAFDMETILSEACGSGNTELVVWLYENIDCKLYNIKSAMLMACVNNRSNVVRWILNKFDHRYFDMQMATIVACEWGRIELA